MAGRIPPHFIDELIARTDIIEVIGSRVQLKRAGREYKACCPFHDEKSPSFTVSADKQFYHCFGCGAHGTALGFMMEYDHLGFVEAVEELAARAGLEVPREGGAAPAQPHDELYVALERAALYFRQSLGGEARAREYLAKRGLSHDIIQRFGIGFAPARWDGLLDRHGTTDDERQILLRAGLIIERQPDATRGQSPGFYDRFRDRVMFPIRDTRGRTIGFGGRVLDGSEPKYLNSPETELFHKGRELYGLFECRQATQEPPAAARGRGLHGRREPPPGGHHLRGRHARAPPRRPSTCSAFSVSWAKSSSASTATAPGRAAAWRALENAVAEVKQGRQVRFLFLPDGHDPDTLVREEGAEAFEARLATALPLSDYLIRELSARSDPSSVDGRARLVELARPLIRRIPSDVYRELLVAQLAEAVRMAPARLGELLQSGEAQAPQRSDAGPAWRPARPTPGPIAGRGNLVRQAISLLVHFPGAASAVGRRRGTGWS